ncbi:carbohydrate ABC transporter permease [Nitriliruptor alkaliphilus]|uniref:carbohydrate ABC transporter permease n=1 Tax=Nitriliruptor alkaliphilus TaxID=427918 RepID=UPI000B2E3F38|nr:sugar ABC transporter permease [Nitriliruptor alkaliphilus]
MADLQVKDLNTPAQDGPRAAGRRVTLAQSLAVSALSAVGVFAVPVLTYVVLNGTFTTIDGAVPGLIVAIIAILIGVVGVFAMYMAVDKAINRLPLTIAARVRPWAWAGPAVVVVAIYLIYPAVATIQLSFMDATGDNFIGFDNYAYVFSDPAMLRSLRNTALWIFVVPAAAVSIGLGFAVLADKLTRAESVAKSIIFLPMAISFIGAGIVWRFVYSFRLDGAGEQIGILNAIKTGLGGAPVDWLAIVPWNNLMLMVIMIWLQTGFAMVILSSAIKGVPSEMLEAGRLDGATEIQLFWRIVVPSIKSSIVVVFTTMVIGVLKVFDIVWVMTGGQSGTEVIAERMIRNMFTFRHFGRGSAVAVFMFVAVIPVMIINVRRFREEELTR